VKRILFSLFASFVLAAPLKAQIWVGDTAWIHEGRKESRGFFYVDTTEYIGWYKWDAKKPWIIPIDPPLQYRDWWMETAQCQGLFTTEKAYKSYKWYAINRESFGGIGPTQVGFWGYHVQDDRAIYLALPQINNRLVVMHEITHALMYLHGEKAGHPLKRYGPFGCALNYVKP
jgi:hypothetical protein